MTSVKLYIAIFLASISMPLATLVAVVSLELRYVSDFRQSAGLAVGAILLLVTPAIFIFIWGLLSGRKISR